jgi:ATP-dependent exoDNAse (exonuclease V) alpha subunit
MYTSYIPLLPHNFLTIHKAQGLGFDKVVVILDDMFEITMLYTAMTRARKELKFILYNNDELEKIRIYNKAFKKLEKVVYS